MWRGSGRGRETGADVAQAEVTSFLSVTARQAGARVGRVPAAATGIFRALRHTSEPHALVWASYRIHPCTYVQY